MDIPMSAHPDAFDPEQEKIREALWRSEAQLALAVEVAGGVGTWDWDLKTDLIYCNKRFADLFSVDPAVAATEGVRSADYIAAIHPEDQHIVVENTQHAIATKGPYVVEFRLPQKNGSEIWIYALGHAYCDAQGNPSRFPGAAMDITQRKQMEAELKIARDQAQTILESITDGFFALDRNFCFSYMNQAGEQILGARREELLGKCLWEFYPEAYGTQVQEEYERAIRDQKPTAFEWFFEAWQRWFAIKAYPTHEGGLSIYFRDISDQKKTEEQERLRQEQVRESARLESLGVMAGGIAHDFNNLLTAIMGNASLLVEYLSGSVQAMAELRQAHDPQYKDFIGLIRVLQHRQLVLRRLIDSILFGMLVPEEWVLRHFRLSDDIQPIDPVVLRKTIEIATDRNRKERLRFSIVSDLTTAVQIGDLIEIDRSSLTGRSWRIVELKTGKVNEILSSLIEARQGAVSDDDRETLRNSLGPKAVKQVNRMLAQQSRQKNLDTLVETDQGISPRFGMYTQVFPDIVEVDDYAVALDSVCDQARKSGMGGARISGCLSLFAVSTEQLARTDFGAVKHSLFHLSNPSRACQLRDKAAARDELAAVSKLRPVFDLVQVNLHSMEGRPVFLWAQEVRAMDLVMGRTRLFAHFDFDAFFGLAADQGVRLTWITSPPRGDLAKLAVQIPGGPPGAWGVRATLAGGEEQTLLSGFFGRVIVSLTTPKELIALIKRGPMQAARIGGPVTT